MTTNSVSQETSAIQKNSKIIIIEFISTIAVFLTCFGYLTYKIERQSERTDRLYEMFIELVQKK